MGDAPNAICPPLPTPIYARVFFIIVEIFFYVYVFDMYVHNYWFIWRHAEYLLSYIQDVYVCY